MAGYFYLQRGLFDHPLFKSNQPLTKREAWIWLIEHANFEPSKYRFQSQVFDIPRGDYATSYRALARDWLWSVDRVIRELKLWVAQGMIESETRHGFVQLTVCNYARYQDKRNTDATPTRQSQDTATTPTSTNQRKGRKGSKGMKGITEEEPAALPDWLPLPLWDAYLEMRRAKGAYPTERAKVLILAKLDSWRAKGNDPSLILSKSITSNWTDIYEPKGNEHENTGRNTANNSGNGRQQEPLVGQSRWLTAAEQIIAEDRATGRWKDRI